MLILTRRPGESIIMQNDDSRDDSVQQVQIGNFIIEVTVLDVKGNQVRLGIGAPPRIAVNRKEIHERKYGKHNTEMYIQESEVEEDEGYYAETDD